MPTVSRQLPDSPSRDLPNEEALALLKAWRAARPDALDRIQRRHPRFREADHPAISTAGFVESDAQLVIAREYGFENWADLDQRIQLNSAARHLLEAIRQNELARVEVVLRANPALLHLPLWSGNWGPPMSHAANLGRLAVVQLAAALGARDFQHAFDRALLQGKLECARWLHQQGARLLPGIVMGACETLNPDGLRFLAELHAPFTDQNGNRLAPLALALETYCRNPPGKHAVLNILEQQGYTFPDTPLMALHRGDLARLREFLRSDANLVRRHFRALEIYPPELGCARDGHSGMHWTPLDGTTLLHIAVDFDELDAFELLLEQGADVNARAAVDADGFGGHTPLFNAVVSHGRHQPAMARRLLEKGASRSARASLRKFIDWCETPHWHQALNVTPAEWAGTFPEQAWVNSEALNAVV